MCVCERVCERVCMCGVCERVYLICGVLACFSHSFAQHERSLVSNEQQFFAVT